MGIFDFQVNVGSIANAVETQVVGRVLSQASSVEQKLVSKVINAVPGPVQSIVGQAINAELGNLGFGGNSLIVSKDYGPPGPVNVINNGFDIDSFRNNFSKNNEISKTDKFDVLIPIPPQVAAGTSYGMKELSLQCEVSELPSRDINMIEYRQYAFTKRIPHINQYGPVTFTFYCNGNLLEKKLFDRWLDFMIPADTGLVNYPEDSTGFPQYESDVIINQYDQSRNLIYSVTLVSAIPISIANMGQNWADDSVHRVSVTFAFVKWKSDQTVYGTQQSSSTNDLITNYTNVSPTTDLRVPQSFGLNLLPTNFA